MQTGFLAFLQTHLGHPPRNSPELPLPNECLKSDLPGTPRNCGALPPELPGTSGAFFSKKPFFLNFWNLGTILSIFSVFWCFRRFCSFQAEFRSPSEPDVVMHRPQNWLVLFPEAVTPTKPKTSQCAQQGGERTGQDFECWIALRHPLNQKRNWVCEKRSARVENVQICAGGCLAGGGGPGKTTLWEYWEGGGGPKARVQKWAAFGRHCLPNGNVLILG